MELAKAKVRALAVAGVFAMLATLTGCPNSSGDDCTSSEAGCVCTLTADDSAAPDCLNGLTADGDACVCVAEVDAGVGCEGDVECPSGQTCELESRTCVDPPRGCAGDEDCGGGQVCELPEGVCVDPESPGCDGDEGCEDGQVCDPQTGACMVPADPSCEDGLHNQDESDVDCGGGCGPCSAGRACGAVSDCVEGAACNDGRCDVPPRIRSQMPRAGMANVETDTAVVVEFSDAIDPASVDRFSFIVSIQGESPDRPWDAGVPGRYEVSGNTVTFTPDAPLRALNTAYQVRLCPQGPCPGTIRDREGNPLIDEGTTWTFSTLPVNPGQVYIANTRDTGGRDRVSFGDGQNALVGRDEQRWLQWEMRHSGGGLYSFRAVSVNFELEVSRQPGGTHDTGAGSTDWRNAVFGNNGTRFRITPTGALNDGTPWFQITTEEGFSLQLRCPAGFCDPANLQANMGGSADAWFLLR